LRLRGGEHDGLVVRRELDFHLLAGVGQPAGEARVGQQLRAQQQVARRARAKPSASSACTKMRTWRRPASDPSCAPGKPS
jgi:hypothetical protein